MLEYLRKRQREAKAQEVGTEQTVGPAGMSNQAMISMLESQQARQAARPASGGTPLADAMRARFERQFGLPMDDVRVHHNSAEPAKFDAGAYTYGTDIFIGPGQEELLNHEMTHVAQQKMGQVRPTGMEHGLAVNRSPALEHSADTGAVPQTMGTAAGPVVQCAKIEDIFNKQNLPNASENYLTNLKEKILGDRVVKEVFEKYVPLGTVDNNDTSPNVPYCESSEPDKTPDFKNKVHLDFQADETNQSNLGLAFLHEHGHYIDFYSLIQHNPFKYKPGQSISDDQIFQKALEHDFTKLFYQKYEEYNELKKRNVDTSHLTIYKLIEDEIRSGKTALGNTISEDISKSNAVSDILHGLSQQGILASAHHPPPDGKKTYWDSRSTIAKEAFANMFGYKFDPDSYLLLEYYFPTATSRFEELMAGLANGSLELELPGLDSQIHDNGTQGTDIMLDDPDLSQYDPMDAEDAVFDPENPQATAQSNDTILSKLRKLFFK